MSQGPLDHLGDFTEMVIGQRLFEGIVRYVVSLAHHMLLVAIAMTAGTSQESPGSPRFVDSFLT